MATELKIPKIKVAIVAEKAVWADPIVGIAQKNLPKMGMEVVGVWRPSPVATDVTAEVVRHPEFGGTCHLYQFFIFGGDYLCLNNGES